jgi:hypothetical protein
MNYMSLSSRSKRFLLTTLGITALVVTSTASQAQPAHPEHGIALPNLPGNIQVPAGNTAFLIGHATGTQNYICLPSGNTFAFKLFTPEATLFNHADKQIITHYFSPNPVEGGTVRATWQDRDTSTVWGKVVPGDSATVSPDAIDWLKVTVSGTQEGPTGGDTLTRTTFIQRINTVGGVAPSRGCSSAADVGTPAFVSYKADYVFYTDHKED